MNEIRKFCGDRHLSQSMEDAFIVYCRSEYASKYSLRAEGDTIKGVVGRLTQSQVLESWNRFINELKDVLPTQ